MKIISSHETTEASFEPAHLDGVEAMANDTALRKASGVIEESWSRNRYSYNFRWLGVPIIQIPQDILALQEIIWMTRPDCIIETGVAHGGSAIFFASMMHLADIDGQVIAVEKELRPANRSVIEKHPLSKRIHLVDGSSTDAAVINTVRAAATGRRVMIFFDSNHSHEHVLAELRAYAPLVAPECYACVSDTVISKIPSDVYVDRPWDQNNNPQTAVTEFLQENRDFQIDSALDRKLVLSMSPGGYLRRLAVKS